MTKYLFLAALGVASTNAIWYYPEEISMPVNDMDSWTWMPLPTEADFPFQSEAEWFQQAEFTNNAEQDYVKGWYVTEGVWALQTGHSFELDTNWTSDTHARSYWMNANDMHALVQTTFEFMKMCYFNFYAETAIADYPLLMVTLYTPAQLNYFWHDTEDLFFGFKISSMVKFWDVALGFTSNVKSCTGDFLELVDGAEFEELLTCKYRSGMITDHAIAGGNAPAGLGWSYTRNWDF